MYVRMCPCASRVTKIVYSNALCTNSCQHFHASASLVLPYNTQYFQHVECFEHTTPPQSCLVAVTCSNRSTCNTLASGRVLTSLSMTNAFYRHSTATVLDCLRGHTQDNTVLCGACISAATSFINLKRLLQLKPLTLAH